MLQLYCKSDESKWNPYWVKMLTNSSGTNYSLHDHEDVGQIWPICNPIWGDAMLQPSCKFDESEWNPYWFIVLTSSSGSNHVSNKHEDADQYSSFAISSKIMPHQSYTKSLVNQNEIPIELSCQRVHLALIMILTGMKILTNMTHLQYHPR